MSKKVQSFAQVITQPLNLYNFQIKIPGITDEAIAMIVQSTTFPGNSDQLQIMEKYFKGERVQYPSIPRNGGVWQIAVPESDSGHTRDVLQSLRANYDQQTGALLPAPWYNIQVYAMPQHATPGSNIPEVFSVILHDAWCQGRSDVQLAANNISGSWDWSYQFVYQWIEDKPGAYQGAPNPIR